MANTLVMGASGFLGSHVVKALVHAGRDVRIMVRAGSNTRAIDHLQVERVLVDVFYFRCYRFRELLYPEG